MKFLKGLAIAIGALVIIAVLVLGYLGFVPGVSNIFGSNKPRDLGVTILRRIMPARMPGTEPHILSFRQAQHPTSYFQGRMR